MSDDKKIEIEVEETNLEDLLILGDDKKINIEVYFPLEDTGEKVKARALIKQLKLKEFDKIKRTKDVVEQNISILKIALFKTNGDTYNREEIECLPVGVANAIAEQVLEISGVDVEGELNRRLKDF